MNIGERLSARRLRQISSLSSRKYREEHGESIVEGFRSVKGALEGGAEVVELVVTSDALERQQVGALVHTADVPIYVASSRDFGRLSNVKTAQGILATVRIKWASVSDLIKLDRVIALDGVQDPGNVGTIVRTAGWLGIRGVLTGPGTADIFGPKVLRASMGGLWDISAARCSDLKAALVGFTEVRYRLMAADFGGMNVADWRPVVPAILVVGNEGSGISESVRSMVQEVVTVPRGRTARATESLNVGVATAIIMHRWCSEA